MLPLLTDEDLQGAIVAGLVLHFPSLDLVRVQDVGLMHAADPIILEYAADANRVIVSHDRNSMTAHALERLQKGMRVAGLIIVQQNINIGKIVLEIGTLSEAGEVGDLDAQILYLA